MEVEDDEDDIFVVLLFRRSFSFFVSAYVLTDQENQLPRHQDRALF